MGMWITKPIQMQTVTLYGAQYYGTFTVDILLPAARGPPPTYFKYPFLFLSFLLW